MSGNTSIVQSTPGFVTGTFAAKDVRLNTLGNALPGLFEAGDFAVSQRGAGANMSVDIAQGRAIIDPQAATHQGSYSVYRTNGTAYNTSADGGYTWTAADGTNPRIDLLCLEIKDTAVDSSGVTGFRFRIVDGTPNASATHQLEAAFWPAIPTGCVPIAAIRVPAAATTLTTTNITNLNPVGGGRRTFNDAATSETTTSATYARLATPDFAFMYVPANSLVHLFHQALIKISVASGTQKLAWFVNGNQAKFSSSAGTGVPAVSEFSATLGTFFSHIVTGIGAPSNAVWRETNVATADQTDVTTGTFPSDAGTTTIGGYVPIFGLPAGWYLFEVKYQTSANTLTVKNRYSRGFVA